MGRSLPSPYRVSPYHILYSTERLCQYRGKGYLRYIPYYKRSPTDFPDIPVLKYPPFHIGIIPGNLVAFDPTDAARTTIIECDHTSVPVPTLPGLLDSCADAARIHPPRLPKHLSTMDWFLGRTMADLEREFKRKLALYRLASLAESYTLLYCFRKKERGHRWTSIEELPEKHLHCRVHATREQQALP
jgi:hypothetical protein